jgi:cytochrome P450
MPPFDDLEDYGAFDDVVSGDVRDPYTELARQRRDDPIQRIDLSNMPGEEGKPVFIVYRHEEIVQVLKDNETFSSAIIIDAFGDALGKHVILGMDEPQHGRYRSLVSKAFSQKALAHWESDLITRVATELIDQFATRGHAELVQEFTVHYPAQIIASLLGLPREHYPQFQRWSVAMMAITVNRERAIEASDALRDYLVPVLADRRKTPQDDLISGLAHAEINGERLSDEEIFSFLRLLLPAGAETTYRSLGNLLFGLLSNPDQLDAVRSDRSQLGAAIEEAVRWEAPLLTITRVATRDTELDGVHIPAGSSVMPMLGAANREDKRYPEPDRFDIHRPTKVPISWGHGAHVCLGMHLARLEMRVAVNLLLDRLHDLRLDPDGGDPHIRGHVWRCPTALPVVFDAEG